MLIALSGLPGAGKSTIARRLAQDIGAIWLRIDSIEQAIRESGVLQGPMDGAGYQVAYAVAEDNLRLGRTIVADSVNPWMRTRDAWREAGRRAGVRTIEVEVVCSEADEHRRRVETRRVDVAGLALPDWQAVVSRDYRPWTRERLVIDTFGVDVAACVARIRAAL